MFFPERFTTENIFFWSDLHLGHNRDFIFGPRHFTTVEEHDEALIGRWNKKIPAGATVFVLGDFIFGPDAEARLQDILMNLTGGRIFIMPGNHHSGVRQLKQSNGRRFELAKKEIIMIDNLYEIEVNRQHLVLSHYPMISWNKMGHGAFHLYGHVHGRITEGRKDGKGFGKMLDVGIESCPEPVSLAEVVEIMKDKPHSKIDHH